MAELGGKRRRAGRPKGRKNTKPRMLPGVRAMAQQAFNERFAARLKDIVDSTFLQAVGAEPDARMTQYVWDRLLGKPSQQVDLGAGPGLAGVEVTYRIIAAPKDHD